jgi:3-hydroxyacyl-CoA dehydrogenase
VADQLCARGRLGQKTRAGWYRYEDDRTPIQDPDVVDLIRSTAASAGIRQQTFTDQAIVERLVFALVNEGFRVLDEGFARRALDVDVIYVNGYGFPAWRGGPLFYADRVGLGAVHQRIESLARELGPRWTPAPLLSTLAESGTTLRDFERARTR